MYLLLVPINRAMYIRMDDRRIVWRKARIISDVFWGGERERERDNACDVGKRRLVRGVNYMMITHQQMGHD